MVGEAIDSYHATIHLKPDHGQALRRLAWIYATSPDSSFRDVKQAVELAARAVKVAPKDGTCWTTLGAAHYRAGDWKAAVESLGQATKLRKGGGSDWFFLAMAHWQLGQKEEARKWYDQAVQWMDKDRRQQDDETRRFRAEAAALLGLTTPTKGAAADTKGPKDKANH